MNELWLIVNGAALAASLAHVLIDYHIGLYGRSSASMQPVQAFNLAATCLVFGCWSIALGSAAAGSSAGSIGALIVAIGWAVIWNGAIGLCVSPPPSSAFPYQDLAHAANLLVGGWAAYLIWRKLPSEVGSGDWIMPIGAIVVLLAACVTQSIVGWANRANAPTS